MKGRNRPFYFYICTFHRVHTYINTVYNFKKGVGVLKTIAIVGGDAREWVLMKELAKLGYKLKILATPEAKTHNNIEYYSSLNKVIKNTDVVIAPMSSTDEEGY